MLQVGQRAPGFELPDAAMEMVNLASFNGRKNVVLYFYPKDDTPGCTLQAMDFSDLEDEFARHDTVVFGVSRDDCLSHASFRDKHGITVQLLADTEGETCERYGVCRLMALADRVKVAISRTTFIIDKRGVLRYILPRVTPRGHAAHVLKLIKELD